MRLVYSVAKVSQVTVSNAHRQRQPGSDAWQGDWFCYQSVKIVRERFINCKIRRTVHVCMKGRNAEMLCRQDNVGSAVVPVENRSSRAHLQGIPMASRSVGAQDCRRE